MANRLVSLVVLVLATSAWVLLRRQQQRAAHEPPRAKPVPVQTWEGEGGALPVTGSQLGPDPAVKPQPHPDDAREAEGAPGLNPS